MNTSHVGEGGLWDVEDTEGDEGQAGKRLAAAWRPTKDEVIEHNLTHIPFRNWCRHCIRGRAANDPHPHTTNTENEVPVISVDYCWMAQGNVDPECLEHKEKDVVDNWIKAINDVKERYAAKETNYSDVNRKWKEKADFRFNMMVSEELERRPDSYHRGTTGDL